MFTMPLSTMSRYTLTTAFHTLTTSLLVSFNASLLFLSTILCTDHSTSSHTNHRTDIMTVMTTDDTAYGRTKPSTKHSTIESATLSS